MSSDIQYLQVNDKGEINVDLTKHKWFLPLGKMWISVELVDYLDENNKKIEIKNEEKTKVKFQFSNESNYFEKMSNTYTEELTKGLFNINGRIKYDFAVKFFKKPHKSNLVAPAYFLEVEKYRNPK